MKKTLKNRKKRREFIENIKLFLVLFFFMIVVPFLGFAHWLYFGY